MRCFYPKPGTNDTQREIKMKKTLMTMTAALALTAAAASAEEVHVYNWSDYIDEALLEKFEQETGIKLIYDVFDSNDVLETKMLAGKSGYDVVVPTGTFLQRQIAAGAFQKLDKSKLPNWSNLDPAILEIDAGWDPGNNYGVPYMWGSVGMSFNLDMVKERLPNADLQSLDILFKPENAEKLADCGISVLDSPTDIMLMVLKYIGKDPNNATEADYRAAAEAFKPIRKYIKTFDNQNYLNAIPNKELCVINNWSGDYATAQTRAKEAGVDINLAYYVPRTGAPAWVDNLCIPADSASKENAYKFINYMLEPEVAAKCSNFTNYANGNAKSKPFLDKAVAENPAVYPDAETMGRLYAPKAMTEEQERILTRVWTDVKSG